MAQDIRELMKQKPSSEPSLPKGHRARFETRLEAAFGDEKKITGRNSIFLWMKVAAIAIIMIALGTFGYTSLTEENGTNNFVEVESPIKEIETKANERLLQLADISPELKKVEGLLLTGIKMQLASLKITPDNKDVIEAYMEQLNMLDEEYTSLGEELAVNPSEEIISAMLDNLKMRMSLLMKLKNKLKELKNQTNEQINSIEV
jgi:hypothetical protein